MDCSIVDILWLSEGFGVARSGKFDMKPTRWHHYICIHCDPLMMQQKEARRKHPCVLPVCFLKKLAKQCEFPSNLALKKWFWYTVTCNSSLEGSTQEARRKHAGSTHHPIKAELGTHTKKATFLGSTHGCFLHASFCCIINGSQCMFGIITLLQVKAFAVTPLVGKSYTTSSTVVVMT